MLEPWFRIVLGVTVLTIIGIAGGGAFMLRVVLGKQPANQLQRTFFRAGHAHAGVYVTLGLVLALLGNAAGASVPWAAAGSILVLTAAIFVPLGFFVSVLGTDPQQPNRFFALIWAGAACLVSGLTISAVAVICAGVDAL